MMYKFIHALHHLFNPHCEVCKNIQDEEYERDNDELLEAREFNSSESEKERAHALQMEIEKNRCYSCEVLERQLNEANSIIRELLSQNKSIEETTPTDLNLKPITPGKRWSVIKRELEQKDRELAQNLKENREKEITPETIEDALKEIQENA